LVETIVGGKTLTQENCIVAFPYLDSNIYHLIKLEKISYIMVWLI